VLKILNNIFFVEKELIILIEKNECSEKLMLLFDIFVPKMCSLLFVLRHK